MWAVLFTLLGIRGLLAAVESALYGTSDLRAKELKHVHPRRGARVLRLKTEREAVAAALRFGMVLFGFTAASIATLVPPRLLDVPLGALTDSSLLSWVTPLTSALMVAILASVVDTSFRAWGSANPEGWALRLSGLALVVTTLLYPMMRLLVAPLNVMLAPLPSSVPSSRVTRRFMVVEAKERTLLSSTRAPGPRWRNCMLALQPGRAGS